MNNNKYFPLERNRYFYGKMLTARDFEIEQRYFNNKRRLINRTILGVGVVCGLGVYQNDDASFSVETGMALDYLGREIVVSAPVIRKLQMVEGAASLEKSDQAFLCLSYAQEDREPVNSIGAADSQSDQFNKIDEGFRLYLSTDAPDAEELYGGAGINSVSTVYSSHGLRIIRIVPRLALSGDELAVRFVVLKGIDSAPVSFSYKFESEYFRHGDPGKTVVLNFTEDKNLKKDVFNVEYTLRAAQVSEMAVTLGEGKASISVQMGDFTDSVELTDTPEVYLCGTLESLSVMRDTRMSTLEKHIGCENTPIYLAKIDCMNIGTGYIIRHITPLPFGQRISNGSDAVRTVEAAHAAPAEVSTAPNLTKSEGTLKGGVFTEVETLEYWQKPQVSASYSPRNRSLKFRFGIPSSEAYDYATASGVVDIPISGAIRVNARFVSQEISHTLGIGDVSITASVEFNEGEERRLLFGNGEIFAAKNESKAVPKIETAVVLYPDRGTFKVGVMLGDYVEGHSIRVRWFAYKPTRDTAVMRTKENVVIKISPDVQKMKPLERIRFKAEVDGSADKGVIWSVKDADGGNIDENGLYQAPSAPGTYEISAVSTADSESRTSAFVIVEE
ncbi:MAG: hypothetical protein ACI4WS_13520 [Oscillospiraceae bacterium]